MAQSSTARISKRLARRSTAFALCLWIVALAAIPTEAEAGPAVGAAITAAIGKITVSAIISSIIKSLIASVILGGLSAMLSKKPKGGNFDTSRTQMIKEPVSPRQYIFGRARVSGALTYLNTFDKHKRAELNITIAGHPIDAVETVYFDDQELTLDSSGKVIKAVNGKGEVIDTWVNNAWVKIGRGTPESDADWLAYAQKQTAGEWTANHKQTGCAKVWVTLKLNNKPGGGTVPNVSMIVRGMLTYDHRAGNTAWTTNNSLLLLQYLVQIGVVNPDYSNADTASFITAANICDEQVVSLAQTYAVSKVWQLPDGTVSASPSSLSFNSFGRRAYINFASPHPFASGDKIEVRSTVYGPYAGYLGGGGYLINIGAGKVGGYARVVNSTTIAICPTETQAKTGTDYNDGAVDWDRTSYSGTLTFIKEVDYQYNDALTLTASPIKLRAGDAVRVSSTGTLPTGLLANTDYFVFFYDNNTSVIGLATTKVRAEQKIPIDLSSDGSGVITVTKAYEARYTCNGRLASDTQPIDAIPALLGSMVGTLVYVGGKWKVLAGAYSTPTLSFDENDLDGWPNTSTRIPYRDKFNTVKGTFYSPAAFYESTSFPAVNNDYYIEQDGAVSNHDIDLPFTNSPGMCQRIAKCLLEAVRQEISTTWPMKLTAMKCQAGDIVMLNRAALGWVNKPFQVIGWQLTTRQGDNNETRLGVDVSFREISSAMFDWNSGDESDVDAAPNSNLPNPFVVEAPGTPIVTEREVVTNDSQSVKSVVDLNWDYDDELDIASFEVRYKLHDATTWIPLPRVLGSITEATIYGLEAGYYDFSVRALNRLGAESPWTYSNDVEIRALLSPPETITGLTLQEVSSLAVLRWNTPTQASVRINGQIRIRHTEATLALATLGNSVEIIPAVAGSSNHAVVPLKKGTYLVYAQNAAGALSLEAALVSSNNATVLDFSTLGVVQEDPLFPGTHTNTVVDATAQVLKLESLSNIDDMGDFDAIPDFDSMGGVVSAGTYDFAAGLDLGSIQRVRLETTLTTQLVNILDDFDARTANVDDWPDFDGIEPGIVGDAQIQVRTTDDDPSGTPTWSPWNWLVAADYYCRAFEFRLVITVNDPAYNLYVYTLRITAKQL